MDPGSEKGGEAVEENFVLFHCSLIAEVGLLGSLGFPPKNWER